MYCILLLFMMQFTPASYYILPLGSYNILHTLFVKHPWSMFYHKSDRPNLTYMYETMGKLQFFISISQFLDSRWEDKDSALNVSKLSWS